MLAAPPNTLTTSEPVGSETAEAILTREDMRVAFVIAILGMLASGGSSQAQSPARRAPAAVARRFIDAQRDPSSSCRQAHASLSAIPGGSESPCTSRLDQRSRRRSKGGSMYPEEDRWISRSHIRFIP